MPRERVEFVQSQLLPWDEAPLAGLRPGTAARVLSADDETGASSLIVRYPPGWRGSPGQALAVDEEFLVLEGDLTVGPHRYDPFGYAHLPAGYRRSWLASDRGAVVLTFFSGDPVAAEEDGPEPDGRRLVEGLDGLKVPYTGNFHPEFPPGAGRKMLYEDPDTGDQTWILGTLGMRWAERAERHPVVEEMFLLAGEVHGNLGVMRPGAYFWRPPHVAHGPYGSLTGNIYLFRTKGGKLFTEYEDAERAFRWWPEHRPVLPERMRAFGGAVTPAVRPW